MKSVKVWCLEYGPDSRPPGDLQELLAKADNDVEPLVRTSTSDKWHFATARRLPEHCRWTSTRPPVCIAVTTAVSSTRSSNRSSNQNRLHEDNLCSRRPARGTILLPHQNRNQLEFALDQQKCQWRPVLFTNESRFHVSTCDRRVRVWRFGEPYADCNVLEYDRYGGGSGLVWAGICLDGRTDSYIVDRGALTAVRYRDEVLHPIVRPFPSPVGPDLILMQDR